MLKSFLYTVSLLASMVFHPFHVSVCDIEHNAENKTLEISQRIFMDDLETGLKKFHQIDFVDAFQPKNPEVLDSLIAGYLTEKLKIAVNGNPVKLNYLGSEVEGDARWCFIEVTGVEAIKEAKVANYILFESFEDQENIVHLKVNGRQKSYRLNLDERETTFVFE